MLVCAAKLIVAMTTNQINWNSVVKVWINEF